jgi:hypothetical protein
MPTRERSCRSLTPTHQAAGLSERSSAFRATDRAFINNEDTDYDIEAHVARYWKWVEAYVGYSRTLDYDDRQRWRMNASVATPHAYRYNRGKPEILD